MDKFYELLQEYVAEENKDGNKYVKLAEMAPTEKARKILLDISQEEKIHKKFLTELLQDGGYSAGVKSHKNDISKQSVHGTESNADDKIDYPDYIENVGLDEDEIKVEDEEE